MTMTTYYKAVPVCKIRDVDHYPTGAAGFPQLDDSEMPDFENPTLAGLVALMAEVLEVPACKMIPDAQNELGRLDVERLEDDTGDTPTQSARHDWQAGRRTPWRACYPFDIQRVTT